MASPRLLADIGGTNARFALQAGPDAAITDVQVLPCAAHATLDDAVATYLQRVGCPPPRLAAVAIANPVVGDLIEMTNHDWSFSIRALQARLGLERLLVLNDFTALAMALPSLPRDALRQLGGGAPTPGCAIGLIGPGTGLGVSGLVPAQAPDGSHLWAPLQGEGGHITLAASDAREQAVLAELRRRHGHASAERALSGPGLVDLRRALIEIDARGEAEPDLGPEAITRHGLQGEPLCAETLALFCALLGTAAGNLALTLGAQGGIYIGGGIVPQLGDWFTHSPFRRRFEAKGRFAAYLSAIPVFVIHAKTSPALLGAARALDASQA